MTRRTSTLLMAPILLALALALTLGLHAQRAATAQEARPPPAPAADHTTGDLPMTDSKPEQHWRDLNPEEQRVIVNKGTERPFTGEYDDHFEPGLYTCRRCGAMLYRSENKFRAHCGWPAFDGEIRGAVQREPDPDGQRTEILCANCGAHLGHVFEGERLTDKNTRHCVNSISMLFVPQQQVQYGRAIFAGGCFWGVEYWFEKVPGVISATSGYIGGDKPEPTYREVCSHTTGHAEAVEVLYDPVRVSYEQLVKLFFEIHDPTQVDGQGPDLGDQYRSEIFYTSGEQKQQAEKLIEELKGRGLKVVTKLTPAPHFWPAEEYHQDYYERKQGTPYCHVRRKLWE